MDAHENNRHEIHEQRTADVAGPRGRTVLASVVILLLTGAVFVMARLPIDREEAPAPGVQIGEKMMEVQGRMHVAIAQRGGEAERRQVMRQAERIFNVGSINQRQRYVPLVAEFADADAARVQLRAMKELAQRHGVALTPEDEHVFELLNVLYGEQRATGAPPRVEALNAAQRDILKDELGWFGRLALAPREGPDPQARQALLREARGVMLGASIAMVVLIIAVLAGFVGLVIFLVFVLSGRVRSRVSSAVRSGAHHGIYAETFALWLAVFFGFTIAAGAVGSRLPQHMLFFVVCAFFLSLIALAWPVIRGVRWRTVREDIGLHLGERPLLEPFIGAAGYIMTLPIVAIGLVLTIVLFMIDTWVRRMAGPEPGLFDDQAPAAHPVLEHILGPDLWPKIQVYLAVSVAAPIVEEIMFRGVFHRHLRGATQGAGTTTLHGVIRNAERCGASILWSMLVVSFIFAAVHPVPWVAIPALMSLAIGFSLLREWRGTLLPAMVAHALHNGLVVTMVLLVLGL